MIVLLFSVLTTNFPKLSFCFTFVVRNVFTDYNVYVLNVDTEDSPLFLVKDLSIPIKHNPYPGTGVRLLWKRYFSLRCPVKHSSNLTLTKDLIQFRDRLCDLDTLSEDIWDIFRDLKDQEVSESNLLTSYDVLVLKCLVSSLLRGPLDNFPSKTYTFSHFTGKDESDMTSQLLNDLRV